ncbi:hypothetical protein QBC37DRAFT_430790 [Rhypophila decipiens]|uniref:Secreted protein n=1 Tax=Rhypophila decipiens TaxID=261697 RepID=A0AAN7B349_9PEZI|nr:hypothetical protein QBC37DRAFT_430790 [Rhypophila decipiens]
MKLLLQLLVFSLTASLGTTAPVTVDGYPGVGPVIPSHISPPRQSASKPTVVTLSKKNSLSTTYHECDQHCNQATAAPSSTSSEV